MAEFGWDPYVQVAVRAFGCQVHALVPGESERGASTTCIQAAWMPSKLTIASQLQADEEGAGRRKRRARPRDVDEGGVRRGRWHRRDHVPPVGCEATFGVGRRSPSRTREGGGEEGGDGEGKRAIGCANQVLGPRGNLPRDETSRGGGRAIAGGSKRRTLALDREASPPAPRTTAPPTDQGSEPEDALKNKLLEHVTQALQGRREDFHKNDVLKAEELIAYVLSIEPGENTESDAMRRARAVARINTEFQSLVGAGEICEVDPVEGTFCLPDQSLELEPVVFAFLQRRAAEGYATTTFEEVQEHVTVDTMVYGANWQKISHSLDGLVASSKVYEVEEGHYRLV
eukprot:scaffold2636_cov340-Pavlova_lutheri.AAC.41